MPNQLGQVISLGASPIKGSFNFLYRAAAVQMQLLRRKGWSKHFSFFLFFFKEKVVLSSRQF